MSETNLTWYKIAEHVNELPFAANQIAVVEVKGKKICVAKTAISHQSDNTTNPLETKITEKLYAVSYTCPHAGGILAHGHIDALGNIVCPLHRYKFDLKNGRNVTGEGYYLAHWPVEQREDGVFIGMKETGDRWGLFK